MIIDVLTMVLIIAGLVFFFGTALGLIRFPDYYTRIHAAGKGDTLSSLLILVGLIIYNVKEPTVANILVSIKIFLIFLFILVTSPTTTHAIMEAGYKFGQKPWTKKGEEEDA